MEKIREANENDGAGDADLEESDGNAYFIRDCCSEINVRDQIFVSNGNEFGTSSDK